MQNEWGVKQIGDCVHIRPVDDIKAHELSEDCWCNPDLKEVEGGMLIIHESMDKREKYENGLLQCN